MKFKAGDEVKVVKIGIGGSDEKHKYIGKTGFITVDDGTLKYRYKIKGITDDFWWSESELEPTLTIIDTPTALKAAIDGKEMQSVTWDQSRVVFRDNIFVIIAPNNPLVYTWEEWCNEHDVSEYNWREYIAPQQQPKFSPQQFIVNSAGSIGIIVEHKGYVGGVPSYDVRFNGTTGKTKPVLESELSEVVL